MESAELEAIPVLKQQKQQAWSQAGNRYEANVLEGLGGQVLLPSRAKDPLSEGMTLAFLKGNRSEAFASQVNLRPKTIPELTAGTGLKIRRTMADLVRRDQLNGQTLFTVIDIKATRHATAFHKAQVAFYSELLACVLKESGIDAACSTRGEIWHIPSDGTADGHEYAVEEFDLEPYVRMVREFCQVVLPRIERSRVDRGRDETFFHIYFKCEQCDFLPHCESKISHENPANSDVSAVPGLSHEAKRALLRNGIRTVSELAKASGIGKQDGVGWSLQRSAQQLSERATSLVEDRIQRTENEHSFLMPPKVDVALFLTVDHDPLDDMISAIGYRYCSGTENRQKICVVSDSDRRHEADAICEIVGDLLADLKKIDEHNVSAEESGEDPLRAHIFVFEPAEGRNLQAAIGRHIDDPRIRQGLLDIVRLFPPEDVVPEPEFRGAHHLPATALRGVVEQLYAMPVKVSYDLRQVSSALKREGKISIQYSPDERFERPFSSLLAIDVIRDLKEGRRDAPTVEEISCDVSERLEVSEAIANWLFEEDYEARQNGSPLLRLSKKPFRLHSTFDPLNVVDLDVLRALEILESRAGLFEALLRLAQPVRVRRDRGQCVAGMKLLKVTQKSVGWRKVREMDFRVPSESQEADLHPESFGLILTDDDPDMRLDPSMWASCAVNYLRPYQNQPDYILRIQMNSDLFESEAFQAMYERSRDAAGWCLDSSFTDINSQRAADFISALIGGESE